MPDVGFRPCEKIIDTENMVAFENKTIAEMGAKKAGTASHEDRFRKKRASSGTIVLVVSAAYPLLHQPLP